MTKQAFDQRSLYSSFLYKVKDLPRVTFFLCFSFSRCLFGSLLHPSTHHWHPSLFLGAGSGSKGPTWEHWGLELCLSQSGWNWSIKPDGKKQQQQQQQQKVLTGKEAAFCLFASCACDLKPI